MFVQKLKTLVTQVFSSSWTVPHPPRILFPWQDKLPEENSRQPETAGPAVDPIQEDSSQAANYHCQKYYLCAHPSTAQNSVAYVYPLLPHRYCLITLNSNTKFLQSTPYHCMRNRRTHRGMIKSAVLPPARSEAVNPL